MVSKPLICQFGRAPLRTDLFDIPTLLLACCILVRIISELQNFGVYRALHNPVNGRPTTPSDTLWETRKRGDLLIGSHVGISAAVRHIFNTFSLYRALILPYTIVNTSCHFVGLLLSGQCGNEGQSKLERGTGTA